MDEAWTQGPKQWHLSPWSSFSKPFFVHVIFSVRHDEQNWHAVILHANPI
jgi:hypothetical protein